MLLVALGILASAGYGYVYITDRPPVRAGEVSNADDSAANPRSVELPAARDSERTPAASASAAPSSAAASPAAAGPVAGGAAGAPGTKPGASKDKQAPTAPKKLTLEQADPYAGARLVLDWDESTDNVGVVGYKIYRDNVEIGVVDDGSSDDTDTTFKMGHRYTYAVRAYDAAGNLSAPVEAEISTVFYAG